MSEQTVVQYLIEKLHSLGVEDFFGLPGDFNFEIAEVVENNKNVRWVGCCNELNAAYASDGYARLNGLGCCITTYGVGELSALNGITGAYAQNVPVIKIVGMPSTTILADGRIFHHSLGDGRWLMYAKAYEEIIEYGTILSKENAFSQIEDAINIAMTNKKPVYIAIPEDVAVSAIVRQEINFDLTLFDDEQSAHVIFDMLKSAEKPVLLLDSFVCSFDIQDQVSELIEKLQIPYITTYMGKGCVSEQSPYFCGVYAGSVLNPQTAEIFKESDCILSFGLIWSDFNSGHFSIDMNRRRIVNVSQNKIEIAGEEVKISSPQRLLEFLLQKSQSLCYDFKQPDTSIPFAEVQKDEPLRFDNMMMLVQNNLLQKDDIIVTDTGLSSMALISCKLPENCRFLSQLLYASIGWATPCAFGAQCAKKDKRVILFTGDGAAQLTVQEISSMYRYGQKIVIFILNNSGYTTERILSKKTDDKFNDIAHWNWMKIPEAFCGDSYTAVVRSVGEFLDALNVANQKERACLIEVMLPKMDLPVYAKNRYEMVKHRREFNE